MNFSQIWSLYWRCTDKSPPPDVYCPWKNGMTGQKPANEWQGWTFAPLPQSKNDVRHSYSISLKNISNQMFFSDNLIAHKEFSTILKFCFCVSPSSFARGITLTFCQGSLGHLWWGEAFVLSYQFLWGEWGGGQMPGRAYVLLSLLTFTSTQSKNRNATLCFHRRVRTYYKVFTIFLQTTNCMCKWINIHLDTKYKYK